MMLYCFITHAKAIAKDYAIVSSTMSKLNYNHYKIFYGGNNNLYPDNDQIININCNDNYEGLPNKIHSICKYLVSSGLIYNYSHFCKVDSNSTFKKLLPILDQDYYGYLSNKTNPEEYRRVYHNGRCSKDSIWNNKRYDGDFVPYCSGGWIYVLSKKSVECISNHPDDPYNDIYEDLYVGQQLLKCNILPYHLDTRQFLEFW